MPTSEQSGESAASRWTEVAIGHTDAPWRAASALAMQGHETKTQIPNATLYLHSDSVAVDGAACDVVLLLLEHGQRLAAEHALVNLGAASQHHAVDHHLPCQGRARARANSAWTHQVETVAPMGADAVGRCALLGTRQPPRSKRARSP
eukprot:6193634-Pleurochrysis_carterae.AAC.8